MDIVKFSCDIRSTDINHPLHISVKLDNTVIQDIDITNSLTINVPVNNANAKHCIEIIVSGKTDKHTTLDETGNVISSTELIFSNFMLDDIALDQTILKTPLRYHHDYNGYGNATEESFTGIAGFNGSIIFDFETPYYIWYLENLHTV
jgi:hypothetical protein